MSLKETHGKEQIQKRRPSEDKAERCCHKPRKPTSNTQSWRGKEPMLSLGLRGTAALLEPWFAKSGLQNCEMTSFCCLKGPNLWTVWWQPQEMNTVAINRKFTATSSQIITFSQLIETPSHVILWYHDMTFIMTCLFFIYPHLKDNWPMQHF